MRILWTICAAAIFAACSSSPSGPVTGTLQVNISGVPGGASANVGVTGPSGFSQTLTATQTLTVAPGNYTVAATNVISGAYSYAGTITGSPATVTTSAPATSTVTYAAATGALQIAVSGLPAGTNANIQVTGPGGYNQAVTATAGTTLNQLVPGSYTVAVNSARASASIVDQLYDGAGSAASVSAGATANATVTYALRTGSGKLWVALSGTGAGYDASQLGTSGGPAPSVGVTVAGNAEDAVFDKSGNLWLATLSSTLLKFTPALLATTGSPSPAVTISASSGSLSAPAGLAIDSTGNLWVANSATLVQFTPAQLATTGSPTPNVINSSASLTAGRPAGLAFDSMNNLWVAYLGNSKVVQFTAAQLAASGSPVPAVILSATGSSIASPVHLAFDATGNLWVSNFGASTVVQFAAAQLAASGSPTPAVTLSASAGSLSGPTCLAFDTGGNLWVTNTTGHTLAKFTSAQIASTGSPTPTVILTGVAASDAEGCAFNPVPASSYIYH